MAVGKTNPPVRGTQLLVEHMGAVFSRPSLVAIEIAWRWLFGIPFLLVCGQQIRRILTVYPIADSSLGSLDTQNPWIAAQQITQAVAFYEPRVMAVLHWLLPVVALAWIVLSGFGRSVLLRQMESGRTQRVAFRPLTMMALQAVWLALFAATIWGWLRCIGWAAEGNLLAAAEPDLVAFASWAIFLSLGFFTLFAVVSWTASIAPVLASLEGRSALSAITQSFQLGRAFTGKLVEINLVLGIVKLALVVVAMVFSAAPLPFSDELGPGAMHGIAAASVLFYIVANDYFQTVRLKAFVEFWRVYRSAPIA